jgi:hypothetical protein
MRRVVAVLVVLLVVGALVIGLRPVSPARTFDDYQHKAKDTAESVLSSVQTARDRLRDDLGKLLNRASDGVAKLRISARRSQLAGLEAAAKPLVRLARELRRFIEAND